MNRKKISLHEGCYTSLLSFAVLILLFSNCRTEENAASKNDADELYEYNENLSARWSSPENIRAEKGNGGIENNGAKGHPYDPIEPGQSEVLLDVQGQGIINRMWITVSDRSPEMLRALKLEIFWDDEQKPGVAVPLGDFFGVGLGRTASFYNTLMANPEGRSFNCFIPMPFKEGARIVITNESEKRLSHIFFDVDFQLMKNWNPNNLYFHAYWSRDTATTLAKDFELLPRVTGKGRFLGVNVGINANPLYGNSWWGEGEVKMYLDGDTGLPTLAGTGTEDYIGTAWGQGKYFTDYTGCLIADDENLQWSFYRFHIPDPVFFESDCRVTIQQIGGSGIETVLKMQKENVPLIPVTIDHEKGLHHLYKKDSVVQLDNPALPKGWTNFYRSDDVSATAYFYLDRPVNELPELSSRELRTSKLRTPKTEQ